MMLDQTGSSLFQSWQDSTVVAGSIDRPTRHRPLNYPISLLKGDLCKTKVLQCFFDLCL